jgi:hypothetical protein
VDLAITKTELAGSNGKPCTVSVSRGDVDPKWIVLWREDCQVFHGQFGAVGLGDPSIECLT